MSDTEQLYQILSATLHADAATRTHAEEQLKQLETAPGFLPLLLQLLATPTADPGVRQAAAVYFKNRVRSNWDPSPDQADAISEVDRAAIHANILLALVEATSPSIRALLTTAISSILTRDFPDRWPAYLPGLSDLFASSAPAAVHGALLALRETIRVYQWRMASARAPLTGLVEATFPTVLALAQSLIPTLSTSSDSTVPAEMLTLIFKAYFGSIQYDLSDSQQDPARMGPWCAAMLETIAATDPLAPPAFALAPAEEQEERERSPFWKAKKWALHCLNRLYTRYGNPALLGAHSQRYAPFAKWFSSTVAPRALETHLALIQGGAWSSDRCVALTAQFLGDAVKHKETWALLKPHTMTLVQSFIHPRLSYSSRDQALLEEDPVEYVQKRVDPLSDFRSPIASASALLGDMVRDRRKATFLPILGYINDRLLAYAATTTALGGVGPATQDLPAKYGALAMIGCISPQTLRKGSPVKDRMEEFLFTHVIPEYGSPHAFMRARACETLAQFINAGIPLPSGSPFTTGVVEGALRSLNDPELPVRVQAALLLRPIISTDEEGIRALVTAHLPQIMEALLRMANEIDTDTLSGVMEDMVESYAEELAPFSVQLCEQLRDTFLRIVRGIVTDEAADGTVDFDEQGDKTMAAMGVLKTIGTLIASLEGTPELMARLEATLLPIVQVTLERGMVDLYDDVFEIVDCCTFASKAVSPAMWEVFSLLLQAFHGSGMDYIEEMLPSLDNFISYGTETIRADPSLQARLVAVIASIMGGEAGESDGVCGCKLMESMMLHLGGSIDQYLPPFLDHVLPLLFRGPDAFNMLQFRVHALEVVLNALVYAPALTIAHIEARGGAGATGRIIAFWFSTLPSFTRVHDKKLSILALLSLLSLPEGDVPEALASGWPDLLSALALLLDTLPKALAHRKHLEDLYGDGGEGDEDDDEFDAEDVFGGGDGDEDEEGDVGAEEDEYLEYLAQQAARMNGEAGAEDGDFDDEEEGDDEDGMSEELMFETPLDSVNAFVRVRDTLQALQAQRPALYAALTARVTPAEEGILSEAMAKAAETEASL